MTAVSLHMAQPGKVRVCRWDGPIAQRLGTTAGGAASTLDDEINLLCEEVATFLRCHSLSIMAGFLAANKLCGRAVLIGEPPWTSA